ncbi:unnamed protein product [Anisakis simplex]|uniref:Uncharacterized protein n=1 Tax=Anisakis simplex TaxID=6269 RepID=A0A0M3J223_ANISI|nr:unnamed protein product [Anisakis simplex]
MRPYVAILIAGALAQALLLGESDDGCGGMTPIGCTADYCPYECDTPFFDEQEPEIVVNYAAVQAQENFDADLEAELLQKDLATYRCDEPRLTHLMLSMNNQQRRMVSHDRAFDIVQISLKNQSEIFQVGFTF